ncbi:MAG: hypothetical protein M3Y50_10065 [Acidobacteriota bacterium]|nr:hypothetical protein [Acidobacteriota bacterium]
MSAALVILPVVWATEAIENPAGLELVGFEIEVELEQPEIELEQPEVAPEMAFYRKYTEALLRRYQKMSMEAGRAPSLLGREMFRGKVTNYRVHGFDDVVIFVHDVNRCLTLLDIGQRYLIRRIALQEYTQGDVAESTGIPLRTVHRRYARALDVLTEIFLERKLLEPRTASQEVGSVRY